MSHLVIVGGSDAGISAALRSRELDSSTRVTLIVEDAFPLWAAATLVWKWPIPGILRDRALSAR